MTSNRAVRGLVAVAALAVVAGLSGCNQGFQTGATPLPLRIESVPSGLEVYAFDFDEWRDRGAERAMDDPVLRSRRRVPDNGGRTPATAHLIPVSHVIVVRSDDGALASMPIVPSPRLPTVTLELKP